MLPNMLKKVKIFVAYKHYALLLNITMTTIISQCKNNNNNNIDSKKNSLITFTNNICIKVYHLTMAEKLLI